MKNKILIIILITLAPVLIFLLINKSKQKRISLAENSLNIQNQVAGVQDQASQPDKKIVSNKNTTSNTNQIEGKPVDKTKTAKPAMNIDQNKTYLALLHTNQGDIKIELDAKNTPIAVNNFVNLAKMDFYNDTIFHRVISGFMIQGGDPLGTGAGGPAYTFEDEQSPNKLVKGSFAAANRGPNTNGSQFFIVTADSTPWLDGKHTNFGKVIEGLDIVAIIDKTQTDSRDKPLADVVIESVEIIEK